MPTFQRERSVMLAPKEDILPIIEADNLNSFAALSMQRMRSDNISGSLNQSKIPSLSTNRGR